MNLTEKQRKLVEDNRKLVYYLVKKINISSSDFEDLVQIGMIGLCKAAATFDESKNIKFATYSSNCIFNEIGIYFRKYNKVLKNELSLDDSPFTVDYENEDSEVNKLSSRLALEEDFTEEFIESEVFVERINLILNFLNPYECVIVLLKVANFRQDSIASILCYSQSYISRLEKKITAKLIEAEKANVRYRKVYWFDMKKNNYSLRFSSERAKDFLIIFTTLIEKLSLDDSHLSDFELRCDNGQIVILLPKDPKAFAFMAQIVKEINTFSFSYKNSEKEENADISEYNSTNATNKTISQFESETQENEDDESEEEIGLMDIQVPTTKNDVENHFVNDVIEEVNTNEMESKIREDNDLRHGIGKTFKSDESNKQPCETHEKAKGVGEQTETRKNDLNQNVLNQSLDSSRASRSYLYDSVINYILKKDVFKVKELKKQFPDLTSTLLSNILSKARKNRLVEQTGYGEWKVIAKIK